MTSGAGFCDSVGMLGCVHCFFALVSPLSLCFFRFVEVSISSGCLVFKKIFFKVMTEVELLIRLVLLLLPLLLL